MFEVYRVQYPDLNWKQISQQLKYGKVMERVDLAKRDLVFSYWGVVAGLAIAIPFDIWLF